MPLRKHTEVEKEPFLQYSDDPITDEADQNHVKHPKDFYREPLISHSLVFLVTSTLWMLIFFIMPSSSNLEHSSTASYPSSRHNITTNARLLTCGNTTSSALASNCKYDILLNAWVPTPCYDTEFIADYTDDGSWVAYTDANLTQRIETVDEMSMRDVYYTSVRDHVNHCAVMWKRQFWALFEEKREVDSMSASPGHTDHCAQFLMDAAEKQGTEPTRVEVDFAGCWIRE